MLKTLVEVDADSCLEEVPFLGLPSVVAYQGEVSYPQVEGAFLLVVGMEGLLEEAYRQVGVSSFQVVVASCLVAASLVAASLVVACAM
jgi:hypothetical protein